VIIRFFEVQKEIKLWPYYNSFVSSKDFHASRK